MFFRCSFAASAVLCAASSGCASLEPKTGGLVAADARVFWQQPKYSNQEQGSGVSLVAEPEFELESEDTTHTATLRPFYRLDPYDSERSHADVRKASYQLSVDPFEFAAGLGLFTWGVLESYRPTDVMNQTDFVEGVDGAAKLGQPYVEAGWIGETTSLRLYYLPFFRERTFPGADGRLRFASLIDTDSPIYEPKLAEWHPSGAARLAFSPGDFDFGIGLFSGISREPRFVVELTTGQAAPRYDLAQQASVDAQWTHGSLLLKAEVFVRLWTEALRVFGGGGAGLEYTFSDVIAGWDITAAGEFLYDNRPVDAPVTFFEHDAFLGLRVGFNDVASTEIVGGAISDVTDGTTFVRAGAGRRFGEHWRAMVDVSVFLGPDGTLESGLLKDDHVHARLAYFF